MFAAICNFPLAIKDKKYVITLGYDLPDDVDLKDVKETPKFGYVISYEEAEDKLKVMDEPLDDSPEADLIFKQLKSTAQVYSKGFIDGVSYINAVYINKQEKEPANENKIIVE